MNNVNRFVVSQKSGLTDDMVSSRIDAGLVNIDMSSKGKSILEIILSNIFTFFNLIYIAIAVVLMIYRQYSNLTFIAVIFANTLIAIIQEIRSKKTLDKLNLVNVPTAIIVRNGAETELPVTEIVLDDIVLFATGNQISCDSVVIDGSVEVNESILTGESESVLKRQGDILYAGSIVVSGNAVARVDKVGKFNYISGLTGRAKKYKKPRSEMLASLRTILIFIAIIIVPMTICLWITNYKFYSNPNNWITPSDFTENGAFITALNKTAGAIISMIPAGPFLLTTVALAVSVIRLSKRNTIVQELYCIEMLARVNCLCLDKTGTITDGTMRVVESIDLRTQVSKFTLREIMGAFNASQKDNNMTSKALKKYFGSPKVSVMKKVAVLPFSSARKLSAVSFEGQGTYILGAPEFVLKASNSQIDDLTQKYASQGLRVLVLAHSSTTMPSEDKLPAVRRAIAIIVIEDRIRRDAENTIAWFKKNGVAVKVISGDNALTVSNIATRVGIENAERYISLEGLNDDEVRACATEYTVFGRVTPDQKAILIKAMRSAGLTVAMTGDGVNDILAMRESDCSISLAGGSDAARNVAHLVLQDDCFSNLPHVVAEGRRVVNNIQSSTSMYFMKTVYVIVINLMIVISDLVFKVAMPSPYEPIQIFLLESLIVGLPTTILALQPNTEIIKGKFLGNVLRRCLPASITFIISTLSLYILQNKVFVEMSGEQLSTMISISYTFGGLFALYYACKPFNKWRVALYVGVCVLTVLLIVLMPSMWKYVELDREYILLLLIELLAIPPLLFINMKLFKLREKNK
ncbi:MAG: HAD-IC family P-type ATPase [Corallococcus sp.]|nr:HAD-IC family P-type ATPase [Corallococcus sp.]